MKKLKPIPRFKDEAEEAESWATHDSTEYIDWSKAKRVIFPNLKPTKTVTCFDIEGKTYHVSVDKLTFRPAVYGVIIKDRKILLSKQWDGYDFPGGGINLGEPIESALIREVKEETGVEVKIGKIIHCDYSFFKLPFKGNFVHSIHLYYECRIVNGKLSTDFLDTQEKQYADKPEWVELNKVNEVKIYSSTDAGKILKALE